MWNIFAHNMLDITQMLYISLKVIENSVGKGEDASY